MLRCINRSILALAALVYFLSTMLVDSERNFAPFYLATPAKYHLYLEEIEFWGQESFPSFAWFREKFRPDPTKLQARDSIAKVLSEQMRDWSKSDVRKLSDHIIKLSDRYNFSPALILSLIEVESRFRPNAVSHRGAMGLMQIKLDTAEPIAQQLAMKWEGEKSLMDPSKNIEMGLHYMDELRQKFKNPKYYLAAYNQGPNRVGRILREGSPLSNNYYDKVMQSYRRYSNAGIGGKY